MDEEELLEIIEDAARNEVTELDLYGNGLTNLPPEIGQLTSLTSLDLNSNHLTSLPKEIAHLTNLKELILSGNHLTNLPQEITNLTKLTSLILSHNNLKSLPPEIAQLTSLKELVLSLNKLKSLPPEITNLTSLTFLDLSTNHLTSLPKEITHLTNLQELVLENLGLTSLPPEIAQLTNLTHLILSINNLKSLPPEITNLTKLTSLDLNANHLASLPKEITNLTKLTSLDLSRNYLTSLPQEIGQLTKLTSLNLSDNPLDIPPPEIISKGTQAILQYLQQLEQEGIDYLYEAKLLIVGEGGAGKTTLAHKILNKDYELPDEEPSTQGIDILRWRFPYINDRDFQLNIWDFGGQEIYHATHQFFLTKRSLYALVIDNRKQHTDLYYWLNVIELLSDNSPTLIVQNERGDRSVEINLPELRERFANLKETLATNLKNPEGMEGVLYHIKHHLSTLPHIGDTIPKTWLRVRDAMETSDQDYISLTEYLALCADNGIDRKEDKLQLSGYLHDLGVCLHFQDDLLLNQTVILKPTWGTDAVYRVLDNKQVQENFGRFSQVDLALIWTEKRYAIKQAELLQLMTKFKLCYPLPNQPTWYIAPHLLTVIQPSYNWDETNNLLLRYEYKFMPKGIITRFIVIMHHHIEEQANVWQNGVILVKDETRAEVIEYYNRREIKIRIVGPHKRDLMIIITFALDEIHASYPRLNYSKLVPCNCSICKGKQTPHFYTYENLRRRFSKGKRTIECDISYEDVSVRSLLDDIGEQVGDKDNPEVEGLQRIIDAKKRRLQLLRENEGKKGINADPETVIEIEDLETEILELQSKLNDLR